MKLCIVIPAYKPGEPLVELVRALAPSTEVASIVVVNDGSGREFDGAFAAVREMPKTTVLPHAVNLGKGAALKTGLNFCLATHQGDCLAVTADADGQHLPEDILAVAREAGRDRTALVLGAREFNREVPLRSKFGNILTRYVLRLAVGCSLRDTQTGLRAIPNALIPKLLKMTTGGYEFELDMLVLCKQMGIPIREVPIRTVYLQENQSSHFDPLLDSMRIYFVLLRFTLASLATAVIDYTVFTTAMRMGHEVVQAQIAARAVALIFNYFTVKRLVFYSDQKHWAVFPRYVGVVIVSGTISYGLIRLLQELLHMPVLVAKLCAETLVFIANFAVLREFIFTRREPAREGTPA